MKERLHPTKIRLDTELSDLTTINLPGRVGVLTEEGDIGVVDFRGRVVLENFRYPGKDGTFHSDPAYPFMWLIHGKGIYFYDPLNKQSGHCISAFLGSKIFQVHLTRPAEGIFTILYGQLQGRAVDTYHLKNGEKKSLPRGTRGFIWPYSDDQFLICLPEYKKQNHVWLFASHDLDNYPVKWNAHPLTKAMTDKKVCLSRKMLPFARKKKTMIGYIMLPGGKMIHVTVRWDEEDEVKIEPFTPLQIPVDVRLLGSPYTLSSRGDWLAAPAYLKHNGLVELTELFIYHIGNQYPQGLSPPIRCGLHEERNKGAFFEHREWGPCYAEIDREAPDCLHIFQLNEGLKILLRQQFHG